MTQFLVASIGSYPRTGEEKDHQRYPRALGHFERKEISAHAMRDVEQSIVQEVLREQIDHGADEVTDGLVTWADPISRFCRNLSNVRSDGLSRYFDNNFYVRTPVIIGAPKLLPVKLPDYAHARATSNKPVRAVLTGPLTLARHTRSAVKAYEKLAARVALFGDVIAREAAALAAEKAPVIQIDEPCLLSATPEETRLAAAAFGRIAAARGAAKLALAVYFGPVAPALAALRDFPADILQLDLSAGGHATVEALAAAPPAAVVGLGATDGRRIGVESVDELTFLIRPFLDRSPATVYLTPSCGLEFLPRPAAMAKFRRLAELRAALSAPEGAPHA